jgi:hypothetical protein
MIKFVGGGDFMSRTNKAPTYRRKKHHSDMKFCKCPACNAGLHKKNGYGKAKAREARKKIRATVKMLCKEAVANPYVHIPETISVGYTD